MTRGRPALHASPTGFLNAKRRVIYHTSSGKYYAKAAGGKPVYNPKAKFHKSPGGTERATKYVKNLLRVPSPIRPKFTRKERADVGVKRPAYMPRKAGVRVLPMKRKPFIEEMFSGYKPKRGPGRPKKVRLVSPLGNMGLRGLFGEAKRGRPKKQKYTIKLAGVRVF